MFADLKDKVAIVTGAGSGIGRAIARRLAAEGCRVAICGRRIEALRETAAESEMMIASVDVANGESVTNFVGDVIKNFGRIDILVNNAGITKDNLLIRMSEAEWDDVMATNLKGAFLFLKAVARPMMKQRSGSIISLSSVVGFTGNAGQCNYAASKAGIVALTKSAARELAARNIRVNAVAPGFIKSQMTDAIPADLQAQMLETIPLRRVGEPEEIAAAVAFLASDAASYMTGQTLGINGGLFM